MRSHDIVRNLLFCLVMILMTAFVRRAPPKPCHPNTNDLNFQAVHNPQGHDQGRC